MHIGHEKLLAEAFNLGERVLIGVSSDGLVSSLYKSHPVRPFNRRLDELRRFLRSHRYLSRARIVELRDPFGPAVRRKKLEALVVSRETRSNGLRLNRLRRQRGLKPLKIHVVGPVIARDGKPVSVTRIRRGEIDARGNVKGF